MASEISYTKNNVVEFADKIATAWHKATESILEVGTLLLDARRNLPPRDFRDLKRELTERHILSDSTMSKLQKIAANNILTRPDYQALLPPSYETLYKLSGQEDKILEEKIVQGEVTNQTQQKDVQVIFNLPATPTKEKTPEKNVITIKGDLKKVPEAQLKTFKNVLIKMRKSSIEITGINLDK